jgi:beta-galactosidase
VEVYSNCSDVELLLNGKSQGSKPLPADASARNWRVVFEPGVIQAACKNGSRDELRTAGKAAKIVLSAGPGKLTPAWDDVSYVTATVTDDQGVPVPSASDNVNFQITGPGAVAAVDNADNASHELFQASSRHAYQGKCIAMIKAAAAGKITISASSAGLAAGSVTIEAVAK